MSHFLLVHGSWHGAWCWHKIVPLLERERARVSVIDLPGRGRNAATPALVGLGRMERAALALLPEDKKTVVVAHSRYGVLASRLAELAPERVERTIYLASYMLPSGAAAAQFARCDAESGIMPFVDVNKLGLWDWLRP